MLYCSTGLHTAQWDSHHHQIESLEHSRKKDEISHSFLTTYLCTTHRYIVTIQMTRHRHRSDLSGCCRRSIKSSQLYSPSNPTWHNSTSERKVVSYAKKSMLNCLELQFHLSVISPSSSCCSCRCLSFVHCSTYHSMQADPSIGGGRQSQRLDCTTEERKKEEKMTALVLHFCLVF